MMMRTTMLRTSVLSRHLGRTQGSVTSSLITSTATISPTDPSWQNSPPSSSVVTTASSSTMATTNSTQIRSFHSTQKKEILPLIGVGVILGVARYSWKAMARMDEEWEDYQWELQQYDKQHARANPSADPGRTLAIDLGTVYSKLAKSHPKPEILTTHEGDRSFFNGILYDETHDAATAQRGRAALERFYFATTNDTETDTPKVSLPWDMLTHGDNATETIADVLTPAMTEAMERLDYQNAPGQSLRNTVTVPVQHINTSVYSQAFLDILKDDKHSTVLIPDPVAAVWGAQHHNLLQADADPHKPSTCLVIDVGGHATQLSIVQRDIVQSSLSVHWGGETLVELTAALLAKESPAPLTDARSLSALQTQARSAVTELAGTSRVKVHVPYLFADPANHHLDTTVSRPVLDKEIQADIQQRLAPALQGLNVLSPHMPSPTDLRSLWTSVVTQLLENSQHTPMSIDSVLLVGGGFKSPACLQSVQTALDTLMGPDAVNKTVVPESSLLTELTVTGAASMLPGYDYSTETGLFRMDK